MWKSQNTMYWRKSSKKNVIYSGVMIPKCSIHHNCWKVDYRMTGKNYRSVLHLCGGIVPGVELPKIRENCQMFPRSKTISRQLQNSYYTTCRWIKLINNCVINTINTHSAMFGGYFPHMLYCIWPSCWQSSQIYLNVSRSNYVSTVCAKAFYDAVYLHYTAYILNRLSACCCLKTQILVSTLDKTKWKTMKECSSWCHILIQHAGQMLDIQLSYYIHRCIVGQMQLFYVDSYITAKHFFVYNVIIMHLCLMPSMPKSNFIHNGYHASTKHFIVFSSTTQPETNSLSIIAQKATVIVVSPMSCVRLLQSYLLLYALIIRSKHRTHKIQTLLLENELAVHNKYRVELSENLRKEFTPDIWLQYTL